MSTGISQKHIASSAPYKGSSVIFGVKITNDLARRHRGRASGPGIGLACGLPAMCREYESKAGNAILLRKIQKADVVRGVKLNSATARCFKVDPRIRGNEVAPHSFINFQYTAPSKVIQSPSMMDRFSVTAGALGITEIAISGIKQLHAIITSLREAGDVVSDIKSGLDGIMRPLESLQDLSDPGTQASIQARRALDKAGVVVAVDQCGKSCAEFAKSLTKWTKHSTSTNFSVTDCLGSGLWRKQKINTMRTQVQSCQSRVELAVQTAQLMILSHSATASTADQSDELTQRFQAFEIKMQTCIQSNHERKKEVELAQQELQANTHDDAEAALEEVEKQSHLLDEEAEALQSQLHALKTRQLIGNVETSDDSNAVVGMPESAVGKMDQRIGDVTTKNRPQAMVGVYSGDFSFGSMQGSGDGGTSGR